MIVKARPFYTPEDLLQMSGSKHFEIIDGQLVEPPMSVLSNLVGTALLGRVDNYVEPQKLGWVFGADSQFRCFPHDPKRVRKPDAAFIRRERLTAALLDAGFCPIAPDWMAEVVSPNDLFDEVDERVEDFLKAGTKLIWVVSLKPRLVYVHRADGSMAKVRENQELLGEDVLPGFRCLVGSLFPKLENLAPA